MFPERRREEGGFGEEAAAARCVREGIVKWSRKYVIRNLVSCIGKSSYYSTSVFSPGRTSYGFSRGACHLPAPANENGESNAKFYFAFPGGIPRTGRDGIFIQISLDPSSSQEAPRETGTREERGGRRIMRAEVVRPLARSLAHSCSFALMP